MDKKYISQITKSEIESMLQAGKMYAGDGIIVTRTADGIEVAIDKNQLALWVRVLISGGNI